MHNNGTNRLILPERGRVLSSIPAAPRQGVELQVLPNAILMHVTDGTGKLELLIDAQTAIQLGVNMISAGSLVASGLVPEPPAHQVTLKPAAPSPRRLTRTDPSEPNA